MITLILLAVTGCTRNPSAISRGGGAGNGAEITFPTDDGWTIHADYLAVPGTTKVVILLHQRGGSAMDWQPLFPKLKEAHIAALALDQRGAGRSQGPQNGADAPWDTTKDIAGAVKWLEPQGFQAAHIGLAGASYGANNALLYAAAHPETPAIALLSPGTDYNGLQAEPAARQYKGAVLILSATDDRITGGGPDTIAHAAPVLPTVTTYKGDDHGTALFAANPESLDALVSFFAKKL